MKGTSRNSWSGNLSDWSKNDWINYNRRQTTKVNPKDLVSNEKVTTAVDFELSEINQDIKQEKLQSKKTTAKQQLLKLFFNRNLL